MLSQTRVMELSGNRAAARRNALEETDRLSRNTGSVLLAAMLAEGKMLKDALKHLKLDVYGRVRFVEENSEYIYSRCGEEAIQIVWLNNRSIMIHRLTSPEMRAEFGSHWLGTWLDHTHPTLRERVRLAMKLKLEQRALRREVMRKQIGLDFGSDYSMLSISHEYPQG